MSKLLLAILKLFPIKAVLLTILEWWKVRVEQTDTEIDDTIWEILYKLIQAWNGAIPPQTKVMLSRK